MTFGRSLRRERNRLRSWAEGVSKLGFGAEPGFDTLQGRGSVRRPCAFLARRAVARASRRSRGYFRSFSRNATRSAIWRLVSWLR